MKKKETIGPPIGNRSSRLAVERDEVGDREMVEAESREKRGMRKKGPSPHGRLSSFECSVAPSVPAVVSLNRNHSATMNCLPIMLQISLFSRWKRCRLAPVLVDRRGFIERRCPFLQAGYQLPGNFLRRARDYWKESCHPVNFD